MRRNPRVQYGAPKRCAGTCGQTYPNTEVYFPSAHDPKNPRSLRARCHACQRAVKHAAYLERKAGKPAREKPAKREIRAVEAISEPIRYEDLPAYQTLLKIREIAQRAEGRRALMADAHARALKRWAARREQDVA